MSLFDFKNKSYLGIDIGTESIKLVELFKDNSGSTRLVTYGVAEQKTHIPVIEKNTDKEIIEVGSIIKMLCKKSKVSTNLAVTSIPTFDVFSSILTLPADIKPENLSKAIEREAQKLIPMSLDKMTLDYDQIKINEILQKDKHDDEDEKFVRIRKKERKYNKYLITAASNDLINKYVNIFTQADLKLLNLEIESIALGRSLIGNDPNIIMVVDIGSNNTSISVFDHGVPVFNRGIDTAAEHIKKKIGEVLQISQEEAEQVKRDLAHYTIALKGKPKIPQTLKIALSPIINEISYIINLFKNKASNFTLSERNISVEKIILTGGGAWMPYFMRYLSDLLNVKVYIGDPWARISYPEDLDFILEEAGPRLAISVGLALSKL